ncbi:hypothetical protein MMC07_002535 [Pseudocyphellaria aurata]|nr:hypothetical protein [Pseudocyphellaria aurata]
MFQTNTKSDHHQRGGFRKLIQTQAEKVREEIRPKANASKVTTTNEADSVAGLILTQAKEVPEETRPKANARKVTTGGAYPNASQGGLRGDTYHSKVLNDNEEEDMRHVRPLDGIEQVMSQHMLNFARVDAHLHLRGVYKRLETSEEESYWTQYWQLYQGYVNEWEDCWPISTVYQITINGKHNERTIEADLNNASAAYKAILDLSTLFFHSYANGSDYFKGSRLSIFPKIDQGRV